MLVKYSVDDEICVAEMFDASFFDGVLTFVPLHPDFKSLVIKNLSSIDAKYILGDLFHYGKVDVTQYKKHTSYDEDDE